MNIRATAAESAPGPEETLAGTPVLSVVCAVRDEAAYLPALLDDLAAQDCRGEAVEILFANGRSDDETLSILNAWRARDLPFQRVLVRDNPARAQYSGINQLIRLSSGEAVLVLDGHCHLPNDFLRANLEALARSSAGIVGGFLKTQALPGPWATAIASVLAHRLGGGPAAFRHGARNSFFTDAVPFPCIRRRVFHSVGLFREDYGSNADIEFFHRVRGAGFSIWLERTIRSTYCARPSLRSLARQMFRNAYWLPAQLRSARFRHWVPLLCAVTIVVLGVAGVFHAAGRALLLAAVTAYALAALRVAGTARGARLSPRDRLRVLCVLPVIHAAYAAGWIAGLLSPAMWSCALSRTGPPAI